MEELKKLREEARLGGGIRRIEKQHAKGKLTARERLELLLDEDTFQEINPFLAPHAPDFGPAGEKFLGEGVITGYGTIEGRRVCVYAQDFTVWGGSFSQAQAEKICQLIGMALESGIPIIGLYDSVGARLQEGICGLAGYAELFWHNTMASGVIPQIAVILGPCPGSLAYSPALADFIIMVQETSQMFTSPEVIAPVAKEEADLEALGGAMTHSSKSGLAHFAAEDEEQALALTRKLLSYLPSNNMEDPPYLKPTDDPWRMDKALDTIVPEDPARPYEMKEVIQRVCDRESFFAVQEHFAPHVIVGFARLHGQVVGLVAHMPGRALDIDAADKITRFVRFCDCFNIPLLTFIDSPGFLPGVAQEHGGSIRHVARVAYAYSEATVPKISVIIRKAYGGAYVLMSSKGLRTDLTLAWPTAEIALMEAERAVELIFRREVKEAGDPAEKRARLMADFQDRFSKPFAAAATGHIDDIIMPHETRPRLIAALEFLKDKCASLPPKKHGNMPV